MAHRRVLPAPRGGALVAAMGFALATTTTDTARAEPQTTVGVTAGVAGLGSGSRPWGSTSMHLGARGDVLFGRADVRDVALGPYLEVGSNGFAEGVFGGGASVLIPVVDPFPVVASLGAYGRVGSVEAEPGVSAALFWGSRSLNLHSRYALAAGVLVQGRYGLGERHATALEVGAQLDLVAMSLPFVLLWNAMRGQTAEARSLR